MKNFFNDWSSKWFWIGFMWCFVVSTVWKAVGLV